MADPNTVPNGESKKDTVRINLPAGTAPAGGKKPEEQAKRDTSAMAADQAKKETAMMGMPSEPKKETSRVAVPATKPVVTDMPRPTVRLRREPLPTTPGSAAPTMAARPQVPEMPRPTVKLKVEEAVTVETAGSTTNGPTQMPVTVEARSSAVDVVLSLLATAASVAVLGYLVFVVSK